MYIRIDSNNNGNNSIKWMMMMWLNLWNMFIIYVVPHNVECMLDYLRFIFWNIEVKMIHPIVVHCMHWHVLGTLIYPNNFWRYMYITTIKEENGERMSEWRRLFIVSNLSIIQFTRVSMNKWWIVSLKTFNIRSIQHTYHIQ